MATEKIKLTKTSVESIAFTKSGQVFLWDRDLPGFGLRVGTGSKTFIAERRIDGKTVRATLGKHPVLSAPLARDMASKVLGGMVSGINPIVEKRERKIKGVTLSTVFEDFLNARTLKPKTIRDYKRVMNVSYPDWQQKPVTLISKDMVERRHVELGGDRGEAFANLSARTLRSVLNFATLKYENAKGVSILSFNPVSRLSANKQWFKVDRRTGHLKPHQFKAWFSAVLESESIVTRDYLQFVLLTGCRREEAAGLLWTDVSLADRSFFIRDPKNHRPMNLPLSNYLVSLLAGRRNLCGTSIFVFPGEGATGHLVEPKRLVIGIGEKIDHHFTVHDLRRTFVTVAESLDIPQYSLKALVNHKSADDVTGGYIQLSVERLREPMQRIADFILESADIRLQAK